MNRCRLKSLCCAGLLAIAPSLAMAQGFDFSAPASADAADTPAVMRDLAERVLPVYEERDPELYRANLSALQLVAANYGAADDTRQTLRERRGAQTGAMLGRNLLYDLYAEARASGVKDAIPFEQAFSQAFRARIPALNDRDAYALTTWLEKPLSTARDGLQKALDQIRAQPRIGPKEAVDLVWAYLAFEAPRSASAVAAALAGAENERRYLVEEDVRIQTPRRPDLYARVVRPKSASAPLPALLEFTLHRSADEARNAAAHGYVGVVAYTRGTHKAGGRIVPFRHDGEDARAVIAWITRQPWSDGRVGMFGGRYSGFAAWAATKRLPSALKAIATEDAMAPGIDFPMEGQVFRNAALRWARDYAQGAEGKDEVPWQALDQRWYASGRPYRDLDRVAKAPSELFRTWLTHPSYDRYWQKMIPFREQFARIDIPVLSTTGYFADGAVGALHYFSQHRRYRPDADHTLLIGPYDEHAMDSGTVVETAARIDLHELRFQWFDHVFKGAARPALLRDRVNFEVMGANQWRHAASVEAMSTATLRLHLEGAADADSYRLAENATTDYIEQVVKFAERKPDPNAANPDVLRFLSAPMTQPTELSGLLSGLFDFRLNKMDVDLNLTLYEQTAGGERLLLCDPYEFRASYTADRVNRRLLKAGVHQQLAFRSEQLMSRRLRAGSRLLLVLGVNKRSDRQINYGSGKAVNEESIADARVPLRIRWYGGSFIDVPVRR